MGITTNGLVLYLPLYSTDLQGSPITSKDANQHSCTVTGATWGVKGRLFDGDDLINCGNKVAFDLVNIGTVLMWVNRGVATFSNEETFIGRESTTGAGPKWLFWYNNGALGLHYRNTVPANVTLASDAWAPAENTWYLIGFAYTLGTGVTFYINGAAAGTAADVTTPIAVDYQMYIGAAKERLYLSATVGDVLIYNRVLTADEITAIYNETIKTYKTCWDFATWA